MNKKFSPMSVLLLLALLSGLALAACGSAATAQPPTQAPLAITLKAADLMFDPMRLTAKVGQPITLSFQNAGALEHSFVIDTLNVKLEHVLPGQTATVTFTPTTAGTFDFYCNVPGHKDAGMKGTLTVSS